VEKQKNNSIFNLKQKQTIMKKTLAIVATVATVLMSCNGGTTTKTAVDSTKVDSVKVDTAACTKDTCKKVDTAKKVK
jgi:hypothetical protein